MVLPMVAITIAGQNMSGAIFRYAITTGSEPSGSSVADTSATTKMPGKPTVGRDNTVNISLTHSITSCSITSLLDRLFENDGSGFNPKIRSAMLTLSARLYSLFFQK